MTAWIIIIVFILLIGAGLHYASPLLRMSPVKTGQIPGTNIYAVKNAINTVFLIKTDNGYILIDAGLNTSKLENSLREAGINIDDVIGSGKIGVHPFTKSPELSGKTIEGLRGTIDGASIVLTSHYGLIRKNGNS